MKTRTSLTLGAACAGIIVLAGAAGFAGPLDPPPGPIGPTYKTLTEVEPRVAINATNTPGNSSAVYRITEPGSYYLTGNVVGDAGKAGIEVAQSDVTIDLNGFELVGVSGSLDGIVGPGIGGCGIVIRNGTIREWDGSGVDTTGTSCAQFIDLRVLDNGLDGIRAATNSLARGCTARLNGGAGVSMGNNSLIVQCVAQENFGDGFRTDNGVTISDCSAGNNGAGGISTGNGSVITACATRANGGTGIMIAAGCTVTACNSSFNLMHGIDSDGVNGSVITNNTLVANTGDGIRVAEDCLVKENNCDSNGFGAGDGAGIHAIGRHNRIEGNNVADNDRGIHVASDLCIILRNSAFDNAGGSYVIAPGNITATIVTSEASLNAAANANVNIAF